MNPRPTICMKTMVKQSQKNVLDWVVTPKKLEIFSNNDNLLGIFDGYRYLKNKSSQMKDDVLFPMGLLLTR